MRVRATLAVGCLSFANLCALNLWHDVQRLEAKPVDYFRAEPAGNTLFMASLVGVVFLALLFYVIALIASQIRHSLVARLLRLLFILAFLFPVRLLHYILIWSDLPQLAQMSLNLLLLVCYGAVVGGAAWYWFTTDETPVSALRSLNLALAPLLPIIFLSHGIHLLQHSRSAGEFKTKQASAVPHAAGQRVLWLIFDEFDFDVAFENRPSSVQLPELDRLRRESLFATKAYPPFGETLGSMPALINGRNYGRAEVTNAGSIDLTDTDGRVQLWRNQDTLFAHLNSEGLRSGVVGWYHPYCRIFGESLNACTFVPATKFVLLVRESYANDLGVRGTAVYLLLQQLRFLPAAPVDIRPSLDRIARSGQIAQYGRVHREAMNMVTDAQLDVVMLHYPIPHPYGIYDRDTQSLTLADSASYLDNLALADRVVGELRAALESSHLEDRTAIVLSSDHSLRDGNEAMLPGGRGPGLRHASGMGRIPFLVMLPADRVGREYTRPMDTVLTAGLISALAEGRVKNLNEVRAFLTCAGKRSGSK